MMDYLERAQPMSFWQIHDYPFPSSSVLTDLQQKSCGNSEHLAISADGLGSGLALAMLFEA
jgi:hypothetical protein